MLSRNEFEEEIKFSIGERYNPLFSTAIFTQICFSFYNYIFYKKLDLDFEETRIAFLEDLQEWEHLKGNFKPKKLEKNLESERLKQLFIKEKEFLMSQL